MRDQPTTWTAMRPGVYGICALPLEPSRTKSKLTAIGWLVVIKYSAVPGPSVRRLSWRAATVEVEAQSVGRRGRGEMERIVAEFGMRRDGLPACTSRLTTDADARRVDDARGVLRAQRARR